MAGRSGRHSMLKWMPYSNVSVHDGRVIIGGTMGNVLDSLQQCLNFSYTASIPEDRQWGRIFPDGTATGMIGMLVRNEADWAVNPFAQTHERFLATRFTAEMLCADFAILAGSPRDDGMGGASLFGYIFAFDWQVWAMLVLFLQLLPLLLAIGDHLLLGVAMSASYIGHWYHLVKICCLEASNESHRRRDVRSRLVVGVWWLANLILLTALTGNMKAGLTVRTAGERVDSIADVARRKDLTPILWKGTAYESVVKNTPLDVYQSVYRRVIERNGTRTGSELYTPETFRLVLSGRAVVLNEQPSMLYNVARACTSMPQGQFYFAREPVFNQGISMTLRRGLDLATHNRISRKVRALNEAGLIAKWLDDTIGDFGRCTAQLPDVEVQPMEVRDLRASLLLLAIFLSLSLAAFGLELVACSAGTRRPASFGRA